MPAFPKKLAHSLGKPRISSLEVHRILWPVDASQMKDDIGVDHPALQVLDRILLIENPCFAVLAFKQMNCQVTT
jgi:hypothetical protein